MAIHAELEINVQRRHPVTVNVMQNSQSHEMQSYRALFFDEPEEYQDYIAMLTNVVSADPLNASAYNNRGVAYGEIGETENAIADFERAARANPQDPVPCVNLAELFTRQGDARAILHFDKALSRDPTSKALIVSRALGLQQLGEHSLAIAGFTDAINLNPEFRQTYLSRAKSHNILGNKDQADADFATAKSIRLRNNSVNRSGDSG